MCSSGSMHRTTQPNESADQESKLPVTQPLQIPPRGSKHAIGAATGGKSPVAQFPITRMGVRVLSVPSMSPFGSYWTVYRSSTLFRASILVRALGPRGDGTDVAVRGGCCCTAAATRIWSALWIPPDNGETLGPTDAREEGDEPLRAPPPIPIPIPIPAASLPKSTDPYPNPDFCFLLPKELSNPPVIALTVPVLGEPLTPPYAAAAAAPAAAASPPSPRSTSWGYGSPSGVRAIG